MLNTSKQGVGFSLLEMLIVILIISILATLGVRLYQGQLIKAQRYIAKAALFQVSSQLELFYQNHHTYENVTLEKLNFSSEEMRGYEIQFAKLSQGEFLIQAVPVGAQANDLECGALSIDQAGRKMITGLGLVSDCWLY